MGGLRTAGDLVARMQMTRRMRLPEAKAYVADRLGVSPADLSDPVAMAEVRRERGLGTIPTEDTATVDDALAIEAKLNIARVLDVPVRSVERLRALDRRLSRRTRRQGEAEAGGAGEDEAAERRRYSAVPHVEQRDRVLDLLVARRLVHGHDDERDRPGLARPDEHLAGDVGRARLDAVAPRVVEQAVVVLHGDGRVRRVADDRRLGAHELAEGRVVHGEPARASRGRGRRSSDRPPACRGSS